VKKGKKPRNRLRRAIGGQANLNAIIFAAAIHQ
jgi:hypothetical protein